MLKYSANNQTFYRCKSFKLNWLGREFLKITLSDLDRDVDVQEIRQLIDDEPDPSMSATEKDIA